jgi:hypothetical protein
MCREAWHPDAMDRLVHACYATYPNGCVAHVQQGDVPSRYQSVAPYVATDVVSPPLALRRLERSDGQSVTSHERSQKTERVERARVAVYPVIGRMLPPGFPKGCKRIRSYGGQATKTFEQSSPLIRQALAKGKGLVTGAIKVIAAQSSRQRDHQSTGRAPLRGPYCQQAMGVWQVWHPQYGVV